MNPVFCFFLVSLLSAVSATNFNYNGRYTYGSTVLMVLIVANIPNRKIRVPSIWLAGFIVSLNFFSSLSVFFDPPFAYPVWKDEVLKSYVEPGYSPKELPSGWSAVIKVS